MLQENETNQKIKREKETKKRLRDYNTRVQRHYTSKPLSSLLQLNESNNDNDKMKLVDGLPHRRVYLFLLLMRARERLISIAVCYYDAGQTLPMMKENQVRMLAEWLSALRSGGASALEEDK